METCYEECTWIDEEPGPGYCDEPANWEECWGEPDPEPDPEPEPTEQDVEPASYYWRTILTDNAMIDSILEKTTPLKIMENGTEVPNPDAYNCHYYTFGPEYAKVTLAADGNPKWVIQVNLPPNDWTPVSSQVQIGDVVIYKGPTWDGSDHGMTHSGKVIDVDASGHATLISSKMGEYEVIVHHPRDVPESFGSTSPTYTFGGETYPSREYFRKIN